MQFHQILILYRKICSFNSKKNFLLREHIVPLLPGRSKCIISNSLILLTVSSLPLLVYFILCHGDSSGIWWIMLSLSDNKYNGGNDIDLPFVIYLWVQHRKLYIKIT